MIRRTLGSTGFSVSPVALGAVEIGMDYGLPSDPHRIRPTESEAIRFLNQTLELGVNFIDTARVYGASEEVIGKALAERRSEFILVTKLAPLSVADLEEEQTLRGVVTESVETSLRLLQTDYVDVLMIHSATVALLERSKLLVQILRDLQSDGKARSIGASVYEEAGPLAVERGLDVVQIGYSALDRSPETLTLSRAKNRGVGMVVRSVLLKGVLSPRYRSLPAEMDAVSKAAGQLDALAKEAGITLVELAYRYVLSEDVVPLCGTARIEELRDVVAFVERGALPCDLYNAVRAVKIQDKRLLNPANWPF